MARQPMYEHNFLGVCRNGHKRNFVWWYEGNKKLSSVKSECVHCQCGTGQTKFTITKYWEEPKLLPNQE
jgi:hypothetical protein